MKKELRVDKQGYAKICFRCYVGLGEMRQDCNHIKKNPNILRIKAKIK